MAYTGYSISPYLAIFFFCDLFLTDLLFYEVGVIGTDSLRKEVKLKVVRVFLSQEVSCVLVAQPYQAQ